MKIHNFEPGDCTLYRFIWSLQTNGLALFGFAVGDGPITAWDLPYTHTSWGYFWEKLGRHLPESNREYNASVALRLFLALAALSSGNPHIDELPRDYPMNLYREWRAGWRGQLQEAVKESR